MPQKRRTPLNCTFAAFSRVRDDRSRLPNIACIFGCGIHLLCLMGKLNQFVIHYQRCVSFSSPFSSGGAYPEQISGAEWVGLSRVCCGFLLLPRPSLCAILNYLSRNGHPFIRCAPSAGNAVDPPAYSDVSRLRSNALVCRELLTSSSFLAEMLVIAFRHAFLLRRFPWHSHAEICLMGHVLFVKTRLCRGTTRGQPGR